MSVFFAITTGIGTAVGVWLGYAAGYAVGHKDGTRDGRTATRNTFERVLSLARMELIARDAGSSELADLVLTLFRESADD